MSKKIKNDPSKYETRAMKANPTLKKLTEEELLRALDWAFNGFPDKDSKIEQQAYTQLKEMIQQKTVTREKLADVATQLVNRFDGECGLSKLQKIGIFTVLTEKGDLEDIYYDAGITVED